MSGNGTVTHVHSWRYERNGVVRCDCGETNAARGTDPHYATAARLASSLGKPGPMSASEREQQRIAYIAAVDGMATMLVKLKADYDGHVTWHREQAIQRIERDATVQLGIAQNMHGLAQRIDALERPASFLARLRWLVTGR